jgi:hypothetical protein
MVPTATRSSVEPEEKTRRSRKLKRRREMVFEDSILVMLLMGGVEIGVVIAVPRKYCEAEVDVDEIEEGVDED